MCVCVCVCVWKMEGRTCLIMLKSKGKNIYCNCHWLSEIFHLHFWKMILPPMTRNWYFFGWIEVYQEVERFHCIHWVKNKWGKSLISYTLLKYRKLVFLAMLCLGWKITVPRLMQERSQDSDSFLVIQKKSIVFSWSFSEEKKKKTKKKNLSCQQLSSMCQEKETTA